MKTRWRIQTLGEACVFERGLTYSKADEVTYSRNAVLRANNIDLLTNKIDLREIRYISDDVRLSLSKKVKRGSLIICTASGSKSHLGKVAIIEDDYEYAFGGFMGQITPKPHVDPKYLFYVMIATEYKSFISDLSNGMNINNLKFSDLQTFPIVVPSLPEQKRIVAILDEAFEGIDTAVANAAKNLANARELFESYLQTIFARHAVGWTEKPLWTVCKKITVGHVGSMAQRYQTSGIPFLRSQNVRPFEITMDNVTFIDEEFHAELKKSQLCPGDLAIVRTGYPGTAAVIPPWLTRANCSDLVIIRPSKELTPHYLEAFFNSSFGKKHVLGKLVGAAQKHFNVTAAKEVVLHFPPAREQEEIVTEIRKFRAKAERLEALYEERVTSLAQLKQAILAKAFAGELSAQPRPLLQDAAA